MKVNRVNPLLSFETCSNFWYFLDNKEVEADELVNVMNEALDRIDELFLNKLKSRSLKSYEAYLRSVLVESVSSQVKFNQTEENDELENLKNSTSEYWSI